MDDLFLDTSYLLPIFGVKSSIAISIMSFRNFTKGTRSNIIPFLLLKQMDHSQAFQASPRRKR